MIKFPKKLKYKVEIPNLNIIEKTKHILAFDENGEYETDSIFEIYILGKKGFDPINGDDKNASKSNK